MKRLVVVADDFGYGFQRNLGILDCYLNQSVSVVSILANCKHTDHAVRLAIQHKVALSLHFNLTEGKPLSCGTDVSSLIDDDGMFWGKPQFWGGRGYLYDDIVRELDAQIDWFVDQFGSLPTRVDGHQHVHVHPNVREAFAATLSRRGIKETRLPIEHPSSKPHHTTPATRVKFHNTVQSESILSADVFDKHRVSYATNFIGLNTMG
uniref:Carbohydrate deacetylase n=1 Tax=Ciona savignyi TaxID=51511 RepID=H2YJR9_CIOSA